MRAHLMFVQATMPGIFTIAPENLVKFQEGLQNIGEMTPTKFVSIVDEFMRIYAPNFGNEKAEDTQDAQYFYGMRFLELQKKMVGAVERTPLKRVKITQFL
jgi:hypothetical protein